MFEPADLFLFVPELILGSCILFLFVGDLIVTDPRKKRVYLTALALAGLVGAGVQVFGAHGAAGHPVTAAFVGQIAVDPVATLFKALFILIAIVTGYLCQDLAFAGAFAVYARGLAEDPSDDAGDPWSPSW